MKLFFKEKFWNWFVTVVATFLSAWATYVSLDAERFQRPISQREAMSASFKDEIESAEKRGDLERVGVLRKDYEDYQVNWRMQQKLAVFIERNIETPVEEVMPETKVALRSALDDIISLNTISDTDALSGKMLGDAFLIAGEPEKAVAQYTRVISSNPDDPSYYYARARAYAALAKETDNEKEKEEAAAQVIDNMGIFKRMRGKLERSIMDPIILDFLPE